jgi:hypothetical protein
LIIEILELELHGLHLVANGRNREAGPNEEEEENAQQLHGGRVGPSLASQSGFARKQAPRDCQHPAVAHFGWNG